MKYYAGIGSRNCNAEILALFTETAKLLRGLGYTLRSGGAKGCDKAFEAGAGDNKEVFSSKDAQAWAFDEVKKHMPSDRSGFDLWTPYVKGLLARNMMQVLGRDGKEPVKFVLCYAPSLVYTDSSAGGTGWAIRCALAHNISVYNVYDQKILTWLKKRLSGG